MTIMKNNNIFLLPNRRVAFLVEVSVLGRFTCFCSEESRFCDFLFTLLQGTGNYLFFAIELHSNSTHFGG